MGKRAVDKKNAKLKARESRQAAGETKVVLNRIRISPIKLGYVAGLIRGMNVNEALVQLQFSSKRIAQDVRKALQSGIANAENNHNFDVDSLVVKEAWVGKSIVMKRFHARARGRGARILKPFSNLTIVLREQKEQGA
jgi:large subunit ribosomal protein L22